MSCTRYALLVVAAALLLPSNAFAQFRIKLGKDFKPQIQFNPGRDHDDHDDHDDHRDDRRGGQHNDHQWHPHDNWHDNWHNGNVVRPKIHVVPQVAPQVIRPNATFVLKTSARAGHRSSYYCHGNRYYYVPPVTHGHVAPQPVVMAFGGFSHVDELATRFEFLANQLCLDLHYNYNHNYGFRQTYAEAYQIFDIAKFMHAAEHRQDRESLRAQLTGVDPLFHHIEDDVRGWSRHHRKQIGQGGIVTKLEEMEATLHHLMYDVGVHATPVGEQAPPPGGGYVEQAPPPAPVYNAPPTPTPAPINQPVAPPTLKSVLQ